MKFGVLFFIITLSVFPIGSFTSEENSNTNSFETARKQMVMDTIIKRGVKNKAVIQAMLKVERHKFVPESLVSRAYEDNPLPIGEGQTISQPFVVAFMAELADITPEEKVLEIGTGSGYGAAVVSLLAEEVYSIEIVPTLGLRAKKLLKDLKFDNIEVLVGDGYRGWPEKAPFDAIILTAAPPKVPQPLIDQLAEGGKLVAPVGDFFQNLIVLTKKNGEILKENNIPVRFVPMTGEAQKD